MCVTFLCIYEFNVSHVCCFDVYVHFYREKEAPRLTESGFQFLVCIIWMMSCLHFLWCVLLEVIFDLWKLQLMDTNAQLWYIIREYISNSEVWDSEIPLVVPPSLKISVSSTLSFYQYFQIIIIPFKARMMLNDYCRTLMVIRAVIEPNQVHSGCLN